MVITCLRWLNSHAWKHVCSPRKDRLAGLFIPVFSGQSGSSWCSQKIVLKIRFGKNTWYHENTWSPQSFKNREKTWRKHVIFQPRKHMIMPKDRSKNRALGTIPPAHTTYPIAEEGVSQYFRGGHCWVFYQTRVGGGGRCGILRKPPMKPLRTPLGSGAFLVAGQVSQKATSLAMELDLG